MFTDEVFEDARNGTLELICPQISIRRGRESSLVEFIGPGMIRQDSHRALSFWLLIPKTETGRLLREWARNDAEEIGKIIPPERYSALDAIDITGRRWKSGRILINTDSHSNGAKIYGDLHYIECEKSSGKRPLFHKGRRRRPRTHIWLENSLKGWYIDRGQVTICPFRHDFLLVNLLPVT